MFIFCGRKLRNKKYERTRPSILYVECEEYQKQKKSIYFYGWVLFKQNKKKILFSVVGFFYLLTLLCMNVCVSDYKRLDCLMICDYSRPS